MRINSIAYRPISYTQRYNPPVRQVEKEIPPLNQSILGDIELGRGQMYTLNNSAVFNRSTTYYCREDVDWKDLGEYLSENYDINNTDFYCFGCSTGEEAYSLAVLLKHFFGDVPFNIKASDIAQSRIDYAKKQQEEGVDLEIYQAMDMFKRIGITVADFPEYFSYTNICQARMEKNVSDCVDFSVKNILDSIDEFSEDRPSVIFARNMWPYINSAEYRPFANELYKKLAPGSIIVVGEYEYLGENGYVGSKTFVDALENAGFEPVERGSLCENGAEKASLIFKKGIDDENQ